MAEKETAEQTSEQTPEQMTELNANRFRPFPVDFVFAVETFRNSVWPNMYPGESLPEAYFWHDFSIWLMSPKGLLMGKELANGKGWHPWNGSVSVHGWEYYENETSNKEEQHEQKQHEIR